jgi:hypothetical protein
LAFDAESVDQQPVLDDPSAIDTVGACGPFGHRLRGATAGGRLFADLSPGFDGEKWTLDDWSVITLEDWALIRSLDAEGVPKAQIAKRLAISRTTVLKAVASDAPPKYERRPQPTSFTVFEQRVRALLETEPDMPARVIAERVGWSGSITWFRVNVKVLRPGRSSSVASEPTCQHGRPRRPAHPVVRPREGVVRRFGPQSRVRRFRLPSDRSLVVVWQLVGDQLDAGFALSAYLLPVADVDPSCPLRDARVRHAAIYRSRRSPRKDVGELY